jgi:hypothetical protein
VHARCGSVLHNDRAVPNLLAVNWLLKSFKILYNSATYLRSENAVLLPRCITDTNTIKVYVTEAS